MKPTSIWYDTKTGKKTVSYKKNPIKPEGVTKKEPLPNSEWNDGEWVVKRWFKFPSIRKFFK